MDNIKRITIRFRLDDPDSRSLFDGLMRRHSLTGISVNTMVMEALETYLKSKSGAGDGWQDEARSIIRAEIREALKDFHVETNGYSEEAESSPNDESLDEIDTQPEDLNNLLSNWGF